MKSNVVVAVFMLMAINISAQTLIATSNNSQATANHNQRKIVRDSFENVYVIYADIIENNPVIMGLRYEEVSDTWSDPEEIAPGQNPTLSVSNDDKFFLVYESSGIEPQILYMSSTDFISWTNPMLLSPEGTLSVVQLPVADVDSAGVLNVFWIEIPEVPSDFNLVYCSVQNDIILESKVVISKPMITDIAIANHLQYFDNEIYCAIQFDTDSLMFIRGSDHMELISTVYEDIGSMPCISYNFFEEFMPDYQLVRFLYKGDYYLNEIGYNPNNSNVWTDEINESNVNFICIDNILPPIGYSFLYMQGNLLKHGFSYGPMFGWLEHMETISGNNISNPSIAYKHFNPLYVDFIWTEGIEPEYEIFYMRDEKHQYVPGYEELNKELGFSLTGNPNPFSKEIKLQIAVIDKVEAPSINIYNTNSQLIRTFTFSNNRNGEYSFVWDGKEESGNLVKPGIYLVRCTVGDKRIARKIIFQP